MARINIFEHFPTINYVSFRRMQDPGSLRINNVYIPGSISFNNIAMILSAVGTGSRSITLSFGLYSLSGSTLSLANSASFSIEHTTSTIGWITLITSATQDITPGNWYFAYLQSISHNGAQSSASWLVPAENFANAIGTNYAYAGPFLRGEYSTTTNVLPVSIATSDFIKEGNTSITTLNRDHPYIVISA